MYKRFWQNLGFTRNDILKMPEREIKMLDEIMSVEEQFHAKNETSSAA